MRGRSLIAALAAIAPVFLFGGIALPLAYAQDVPAAEQVEDDPNAGGTAPADQQSATDPATEPAAVETAPQEAAAPLPDATPVVASIRAKLADPAIRKDAPAGDIAALEAFYNTRGDPVWITD